jgi:uncharacterized membrane protein (DUF4010 family)
VPVIDGPLNLATASLIGLAVGLEREWSGHATGPHARFAGLRTFFLVGLLGGLAGLLIGNNHEIVGSVLVAAGGVFSIAAYISAVRRTNTDLDATTEVAALVVLGLGVLAGLGNLLIAGGTAAVVVLMLGEKARLQWLVSKIAKEELEAALQVGVLALVVLPLLPAGPFGGMLDIRPRTIWAIALLFSGLNFAGYIARRVVGADRGYAVTGLLGGLVSSTAVTLQFSRQSRADPSVSSALARGVVGACTMLLPRVVVVSAFLNADVAIALIPMLAIPAVLGTCLFFFLPQHDAGEPSAPELEHKSPLGLAGSIRMAVAFQVAVSVLAVIRSVWGTAGLYAGAAALGFTDMDALTVSMSRSSNAAHMLAQAIAVGIISNTVLKLIISLIFGNGRFRRIAIPGLLVLAAGSVAGLWL